MIPLPTVCCAWLRIQPCSFVRAAAQICTRSTFLYVCWNRVSSIQPTPSYLRSMTTPYNTTVVVSDKTQMHVVVNQIWISGSSRWVVSVLPAPFQGVKKTSYYWCANWHGFCCVNDWEHHDSETCDHMKCAHQSSLLTNICIQRTYCILFVKDKPAFCSDVAVVHVHCCHCSSSWRQIAVAAASPILLCLSSITSRWWVWGWGVSTELLLSANFAPFSPGPGRL